FLEKNSFRQQMHYLQRHFRVLPLSEAIDQMVCGKIDEPTAVITFDDGFQNNYDVAFPILKENGLPATIFLTTGFLDTSDTLWFCRLHHALACTMKPTLEWDGQRYDLTTVRFQTLCALYAALKRLPHAKLVAEVDRLILKLGLDTERPIESDSPYRMLNSDSIKTMVSTGLIEFGAHTHHHAILSLLPRKQQIEEISRSIEAVQKITGQPCEYFAYPNGQ